MDKPACDYSENGRACREPGVYGVQLDGKPRRFCERHVQARFHPPDLHKKLPGRLRRTLTGRH